MEDGLLPPIPKQPELFNDMEWVTDASVSAANNYGKAKEFTPFTFKNSAAFSSTSNLFSAFGGKSRARKDAAQISSDAQLATAIAKEEVKKGKAAACDAA